MSVFIPDQLDQMSKKDLLEFAQTAHEESVELVLHLAKAESQNDELVRRLNDVSSLFKDTMTCCEELTEQLAKANERVKELEQAIMSNCYDDISPSSSRLLSLVWKKERKEQEK